VIDPTCAVDYPGVPLRIDRNVYPSAGHLLEAGSIPAIGAKVSAAHSIRANHPDCAVGSHTYIMCCSGHLLEGEGWGRGSSRRGVRNADGWRWKRGT
jgi:hypothetical protein